MARVRAASGASDWIWFGLTTTLVFVNRHFHLNDLWNFDLFLFMENTLDIVCKTFGVDLFFFRNRQTTFLQVYYFSPFKKFKWTEVFVILFIFTLVQTVKKIYISEFGPPALKWMQMYCYIHPWRSGQVNKKPQLFFTLAIPGGSFKAVYTSTVCPFANLPHVWQQLHCCPMNKTQNVLWCGYLLLSSPLMPESAPWQLYLDVSERGRKAWTCNGWLEFLFSKSWCLTSSVIMQQFISLLNISQDD